MRAAGIIDAGMAEIDGLRKVVADRDDTGGG